MKLKDTFQQNLERKTNSEIHAFISVRFALQGLATTATFITSLKLGFKDVNTSSPMRATQICSSIYYPRSKCAYKLKTFKTQQRNALKNNIHPRFQSQVAHVLLFFNLGLPDTIVTHNRIYF